MATKQKLESIFLVVGVVRNCAKTVRGDVSRIANALNGAKSVSWLLIESDSSDSTLDVLYQLHNELPDFDYLTEGVLSTQIPSRTERIAHCRNIYLDMIRGDAKYSDVDYVVVSDFDGMNTHLTRESIDSCWTRQDWDVCTANQMGPYYDIWALRHPEWSPNDCFDQYQFMLDIGVPAYKAYYISVYSRMTTIAPVSKWIEVDAAFGGLGVYKKEALICSKYIGVTEDGREICEHVMLSEGIKTAGFKIFLNPKLINTQRSEHINKALKKIALLFFLGQTGLNCLKAIVKR